MTQYYHPRRQNSLSVPSEPQIRLPSPRAASYRDGRDTDLEDVMASSILVFPSPASERTSSRDENAFEYAGSTPSLPTDFSLASSSSRGRSRDNDPHNERSRPNIPQASFRQRDAVSLESEWECEPDDDGFERVWRDEKYKPLPKGRDRAQSQTSSIVSSLSGVTSSPPIPRPPFHLPFLSCLQTVLNLDESTLHLLSRSPHPSMSVLLPYPLGTSSPPCDDDEDKTHGVFKLLRHNPDKPNNILLIRAAMDPSEVPADANPLLVRPTEIQLWKILGFVIAGGLRAWREVQVWQAGGEPRLVGV